MIKQSIGSIKGIIYITLILLIVSLVVSIALFSYNSNKQKDHYEAMLYRNSVISELLVETENVSLQFDLANRSNDISHYQSYLNASKKIQLNLELLKKLSNKDSKILTFIRITQNMNNYHLRKSQQVYTDTNTVLLSFEERTFIQTLFTEMQGIIQEMVAYDLQSQGEKNEIILQELSRKQRSGVMFLALFVTIGSISSIWMLRRIVTRINTLVLKTIALTNRNWEVQDIAEDSFYELNQLAYALNNMKREIKGYVVALKEKNLLVQELANKEIEAEKKESLLRQAQLSALQAQVNPHFLFNTLNIIGKSAVLNNVDRVLELIESISYIMRYSIDNKESMVRIRDEIENTKHYLYIQKIRFTNNFDYTFDIDESILNSEMPSMIIQPIVENCFKHAFVMSSKDCSIKIVIEKVEGFIVISIQDNGVGISNEKLKDIYRLSTVGLGNVSKRLELMYERENLFEIESKLGRYTLVKLKIPV